MRRQRRTLFLVAVFACLLALLLLYLAQSSVLFPPPPSLNRVAAWMPSSWDGDRARASWEANRAHIQELSPVWYQLDASGDGSINPYAGARDAALVQQARAQGVLVIPLINNYYDSIGVDAIPAGLIIHDPGRRSAHVAVLVDEVLAYGYDGIDIDYESLNGADDRDSFSLFIEELAAALHAHGKLLAVTVHPKTYSPGSWSGPQAQDWKRIGTAVDRFRVMTYAYSGCSSSPGPIAPLWWMEDVMRFATSVVSSNKVYVGIHFYGHDWGGGMCSSVTWQSAQQSFNAYGTIRQWQGSAGWRQEVAEPWFSYSDEAGQRHTVWYADAESVRARLGLVGKYGLGGIAVWRLGGEDPAAWKAIAAALQAGE
ncbi:MAG: glycosyl hydrolase family 18 protein [Anaerolineae bacterium]